MCFFRKKTIYFLINIDFSVLGNLKKSIKGTWNMPAPTKRLGFFGSALLTNVHANKQTRQF